MQNKVIIFTLLMYKLHENDFKVTNLNYRCMESLTPSQD